MDIVEKLARALWEVVPYGRPFEWSAHPNEEMRDHYRARASKLLDQFEIKERS
ncbi:hypothetical protein SEA_ANGLERFISH_69 [Mycobacterium phage Anglerfish]|uniref:DNA binding protein n=1 Tax=Mycobacterium phage TwoPeat TaxID=3158882 RepID=A0AAU8GU62_9CAUD|nr:hypothetical protein PBI_DYNAMIX_71 [Mycobacterium phage Dynamix]QEA11528.1 hypothetical protein SEA_ANGLERFISH_69 [Mycobacterium phage Anglerfish]